MEKTCLYLALVLYCTYIVQGDDISSTCGGDNWIPYENEKCFKLLKKEETCSDLGLVTVSSVPILAAEQDFLMKNVFNLSKMSDFENWIVCQKMRSPVIKNLQQGEWKELQDTLTSMIAKMTSMTASLKSTTAKLEELQNNPVPIGFVYVQLPGQPEPFHVWQTVSWAEITHDYAGLFFRVFGGSSEQFGVTQAENSPRITSFATSHMVSMTYGTQLPPSGWSEGVSSGSHPNSAPTHWGLQFLVAGGEVRPRNTAVRIWKRVH